MLMFTLLVIGSLCAIAGAVRAFNWLIAVLGLDDDTWPHGPR